MPEEGDGRIPNWYPASEPEAKKGYSGGGSLRVFFLAQTAQSRPVRLLNRLGFRKPGVMPRSGAHCGGL